MRAARCASSRSAPSCAARPSISTARWSATRAGASRPTRTIRHRRNEQRTVRTIFDFLEQETRLASALRVLLSIACVLIAWQLVSLIVTNRLLLVPPAEVAAALLKEVQQGSM